MKFGISRIALLALLIAGLSSAGAIAQQQGGGGGQGGQRGGGQRGGMDPGAMVDRIKGITDQMKLTDDQKAKLDPIYTKAKDDMKTALADLQGPERRQKMMEMRTALLDSVKAVLTDDQKKELDDKMAAMRQGGGRGQGGGAGGGQGGGQGRGGAMQAIQRFRDAVANLNLTDDQKPKVEATIKDAADKFQQARQESQGDQQAMREKAGGIVRDLATQLKTILTPEQFEKLQTATRPGGNGNPPATGPSTKPSDSGAMLPQSQQPGAPPGPPDRLEVGQAAPDFHATKLNGLPVQLSSFKGNVLLLVFGSYTSPTFRQRAPALEELRRDYGIRMNMLVIYTREAHPAGGWEVDRNRDEHISIPNPADELKRRDVAMEARAKLKLDQMAFAVDSMDDANANEYHACPNDTAVLISKTGTVLAYQKWFEATAMRAEILQAMSQH